MTTAKAFLNSEVKVGDVVIYMATCSKSLERGIVVRVNQKKFTIQGNHGRFEQRDHNLCYKIGTGDVSEFASFEIYSECGKYKFSTMILDAKLNEIEAFDIIVHEMNVWNNTIQVRKVSK